MKTEEPHPPVENLAVSDRPGHLHDLRMLLAPPGSRRARLARRVLRLLRSIPRRLDRWAFPTPSGFPDEYQTWILQNEPSGAQIFRRRRMHRPGGPIFSFILDARQASPSRLQATLQSFHRQTDHRWELWLLDEAASVDPSPGRKSHRRQRLHRLVPDQPDGFLPAGEWIGWMDPGDRLAPGALEALALRLHAHPDIDFLYCDEDRITPDGRTRHGHFLKPDWSPDLLRSCNYIHRLAVLRLGLLSPSEALSCSDYEAYLLAGERARRVEHLPGIFCHVWSDDAPGQSQPAWQTLPSDLGQSALSAHLRRSGVTAKVCPGRLPGSLQFTLPTDAALRVSIIIPSRDQAAILERCVRSIVERSIYPNIEILIAENGSVEADTPAAYERLLALDRRVRLMRWDGAFNYARINNKAVNECSGEMLLFLNNDTEVISSDWIERMLDHARREAVGAVGAKLFYPDGTVQHGGVVVGIWGIAAHSHKHLDGGAPGYNGRAALVQNFSAVTAACMLLRREVFEKIGGFDENYRVAYNDVDLCLRLIAAGYWIVWTPYAELFHHEQLTRGHDTAPADLARVLEETERMRRLWSQYFLEGDPFYNPNLTLDKEDYSLRLRAER